MTRSITTDDDEELFLTQQLIDARHRVEGHKRAINAMRAEGNVLQKMADEAEQALLDYATGNGIKQFSPGPYTVTIGKAESIDIADDAAVPEEYRRMKWEPNKVLIRELRPVGNWYTIKETPSVRIVNNNG